MRSRYRVGLLCINAFLLLLLLYVRLEGQGMFLKLQSVTANVQQKQYAYNSLVVDYYRNMSLVPSQAERKGLHLPKDLPPWLLDTPT